MNKKIQLEQQLTAMVESMVSTLQCFDNIGASAKHAIGNTIRKIDDIHGAQFVSGGVKLLLEENGSSVEELLSVSGMSAKHNQAGLISKTIGSGLIQFEHAYPVAQQVEKLLEGWSFDKVKEDAPHIWVTKEEHRSLNKVERANQHWRDAYQAAGIEIYPQ